ncbi:hypothetical protein NicSoilB4_15540 [Arthrobacter sp. NicSoilB4]|nr:hypothetical protein NicSoilB4_15540 [Arthrobacter sp. NicSoilB4]
MMVVGFQHEFRPLARSLFPAGPVPEADYRREIARRTRPPRSNGLLCSLVGPEVDKKEGVHIVHTLGFGSGRTGAGLGRIAEVFGGAAEIQGLEPGSSPTSGTCFPCSGAF